MPSMSIFIKTCRKDLDWLKYCLRSIERFGSGFGGTVIVADEDCRGMIDSDSSVQVIFIPVPSNGYIEQQRIKLLADAYVSEASDRIMFVDSDCVFFRKFSPEDFMNNGKPVLLRTRYGGLGGAEAWREITESYLGLPVYHEYMRRMPLVYWKATLERMRSHYSELDATLRRMKDRRFSEFNMLGGFIQHYEPNLYCIMNTEEELPSVVCKQFWSWGGLSDKIRLEIEEMLA